MSTVNIYGFIGSPYNRAAPAACIEKGLAYRMHPLSAGQQRLPEYLARHPFSRVPAIEHDGFQLYETQAITRYLDAVGSGPSLTPADPKAAARMNQVIGIVDWYLFPSAVAGIGFNRVVAPKFGIAVDEDAVREAMPKARTTIAALDGLLGDAPYIAGEAFSLADLHAFPHLDMFAESPEGADMLSGTGLAPWIERLRDRPSFKTTTWDALLAAT
jgi:glutathione S-transferase